MENRRSFLKKSLLGGVLLSSGQFPFAAFAGRQHSDCLTILHTNDTHSHIDAFPMTDKYFPGQGGVAARGAAIDLIRQANPNVLLLDAGDVFQGTPYFNEYHGEIEMKALAAMKYDAITMGNHDFDIGMDGYVKQLKHVQFPVVVSNYGVEQTPLNGYVVPRTIIQKGHLKIGIVGAGVNLKGLVSEHNFKDLQFLDTIQTVQEQVNILKSDEKVDFIVCLSHLGYEYKHNQISDHILAQMTDGIDVIIGGHTHTFLSEPTVLKNKSNTDVIINQVGWAGVRLGRLDFEFNNQKTVKNFKSNTVILTK